MAFPQGIYFRSTDNQTDPLNYDAEISADVNYPRVSAQGNNVGWETEVATLDTRDRDVGSVVQLKGIAFVSNVGGFTATYRIDLPAIGTYNIRLALGDESSSQAVRVRLKDDSTQFADIEGATGGAANFIDATGVNRTSQADWNSNNATLPRTFASTIFRIEIGGHSGNSGSATIAAVYIESSGAGTLDEDGEWIIPTQNW